MEKDYIKQMIRESATKVCQTLNALQAIERQFNDNLVDDNGKNVEAEYYACVQCHCVVEVGIRGHQGHLTNIIDYGRKQ